jgi:mono/diheme cytochrome c family protein
MGAIHLAAAALLGSAAAVLAAGTSADVTGGRVLYTRYCASCHGMSADGRGPVAGVLRQPPSDLRHLGQRFGTPVVPDRVARFVDGRQEVIAHGPREMPIWGERFAAPEPEGGGGAPRIDRRIRSIVAYLETIQGALTSP